MQLNAEIQLMTSASLCAKYVSSPHNKYLRCRYTIAAEGGSAGGQRTSNRVGSSLIIDDCSGLG